MNTRDALWLSAIEANLTRGQQQAAEFELMLEGFIQLKEISEFTAPRAKLMSIANTYRSVADSIEYIASKVRN